MSAIDVHNLTLEFPVLGADGNSLKRHVAGLAVGGLVGGLIGRRGGATSPPLVRALSDVSLSLRSGDRLGLVGPNGSGKTTLLRCLAGVYQPDQGSVRVEGRIASLIDIAMGVDPFASGFENIRLRGLLAGLSNPEIKAKIDDISTFSGLGPFLAMPMKTYSQGMMARLMFAVATSIQPDILLMDEWISVGDADFRWRAHDRLINLVSESRIVVLASHDTTLLKSLCNKFVTINSGVASRIKPIEEFDDCVAPVASS
jgi:lipopolysaccharide transport system ATP-binding protein